RRQLRGELRRALLARRAVRLRLRRRAADALRLHVEQRELVLQAVDLLEDLLRAGAQPRQLLGGPPEVLLGGEKVEFLLVPGALQPLERGLELLAAGREPLVLRGGLRNLAPERGRLLPELLHLAALLEDAGAGAVAIAAGDPAPGMDHLALERGEAVPRAARRQLDRLFERADQEDVAEQRPHQLPVRPGDDHLVRAREHRRMVERSERRARPDSRGNE